MNYRLSGQSEQHDPGEGPSNWNTTRPRAPSMPAGAHGSYVGQNFNTVNTQSRGLPQLSLTPTPEIPPGYNIGTLALGTDLTMYRQQTWWAPGGFPPSPPGKGATALTGPDSSSVTQPAASVPNELKVQVKGKWFVALVSPGQHSIMDYDFAKYFLELEGLPLPPRKLKEISTLTDGYTSGPKEFAEFTIHIPELNLESWKMAVALLPRTARNRPAPILLGQRFFERIAKDRNQISHRPDDVQLPREVASTPAIDSTNRTAPHAMHPATIIGGHASTALRRRASFAGVNDNTVNPRDLFHHPLGSYFGGAPPEGGFS
ncbi:hypothetical protein QC761_407108 [Podospora bellae-mahoneyi]|uniref:Uncharacterized protein n=1 Tax=Podospora bellae-mahoneyi TaxID=2093777 RepID=A0ABR0FJR4_9PEZI|nr:hypothetical protein QC761_407108 [Podospora bellae-mahoneyi]